MSGDMRAENELLNAALEEALTTWEGLLEQRGAALRRENIMREERDRLQAERDEYREEWANAAKTSLRLRDEINRMQGALDDVYGFCHTERQRLYAPRAWWLARRIEKMLARHGFGGDQ